MHGREDLSNTVFQVWAGLHTSPLTATSYTQKSRPEILGGQWLLRVYNNEEPLAPLPPLLKRHLSHPLHAEAGKDSYQSRARPAEYRPMRKR